MGVLCMVIYARLCACMCVFLQVVKKGMIFVVFLFYFILLFYFFFVFCLFVVVVVAISWAAPAAYGIWRFPG